mmetsp:Transcript_34183/g.71130  ORF Transcript_34183/g.71130 Transcript_34183/m.71130 type:complete len:333 (+) Transcript_34183:2980-3978(+)
MTSKEDIVVTFAQHVGRKRGQEDRYAYANLDKLGCKGIAVFDGHGGDAVSEYLSLRFFKDVEQELLGKENGTLDNVDTALKAVVHAIDKKMLEKHGGTGKGSTLCSVIIHDKKIISANVGDCRAVLYRGGEAATRANFLELTRDHTPYDPIEKARIEKAGLSTQRVGEIDKESGKPIPGKGCIRINHGITVARTIGYSSDRPGITPEPEIKIFDLLDDDEFVVAASDGIWDFISSEEIVSFIVDKQQSENEIERKDIPQLVVKEALSRGAFDNLTVVIMWLNKSGDAKSGLSKPGKESDKESKFTGTEDKVEGAESTSPAKRARVSKKEDDI